MRECHNEIMRHGRPRGIYAKYYKRKMEETMMNKVTNESLATYLGTKIKVLEDHIGLCTKIIDKLGDWGGAGAEEFLEEMGYWEATGVLRDLNINNSRHDELVRKAKLLDALEVAGVDNWSGWDHAHEILESGD